MAVFNRDKGLLFVELRDLRKRMKAIKRLIDYGFRFRNLFSTTATTSIASAFFKQRSSHYVFARKRPSLKSFRRNYLQKSALLPLNLCCLHATSACTATIHITTTSSNEKNASSSSSVS
ncbi:hypothetical protein F2Q69_00039725 [Brassica cretica]|uniref:Uncharacterized protein n=1 Tax=Brassica cretica TaxID=69181 RepID=A0A8S9NNF3_BRACR|nr:hypothetical protein F2Q69_00039725 [Brassica cretica]